MLIGTLKMRIKAENRYLILGSPVKKETEQLERVQWRARGDCETGASLTHGKAERAGTGKSLQKEIKICKDLKGMGTEGGPGPSQRCSVAGQWVQAETREVLPEHQKPLFTVKVTKHWCSLPIKVVASPCLEIFRSYLILVTLLEQWGGTRRPLEVSSHLNLSFCDPSCWW